MINFYLERDLDETGISGTGRVAHGVIFEDGRCAMRWLTERRTTTTYDSVLDVLELHGHGGKTRLVPVDHKRAPAYLEVYRFDTRAGYPPAWELACIYADCSAMIVRIDTAFDQSLTGARHKVVRWTPSCLIQQLNAARTGVAQMLFESGRGSGSGVRQWDSITQEWRDFGASYMGEAE